MSHLTLTSTSLFSQSESVYSTTIYRLDGGCTLLRSISNYVEQTKSYTYTVYLVRNFNSLHWILKYHVNCKLLNRFLCHLFDVQIKTLFFADFRVVACWRGCYYRLPDRRIIVSFCIVAHFKPCLLQVATFHGLKMLWWRPMPIKSHHYN